MRNLGPMASIISQRSFGQESKNMQIHFIPKVALSRNSVFARKLTVLSTKMHRDCASVLNEMWTELEG